MNRKLFLILITILTIIVFSAGRLSVYAQSENETEQTTIPGAELSSEEGDGAIALITREESAMNETEVPSGDSTDGETAAENGDAKAETTPEPTEEPVTEVPEAPVPEAPKGNALSKEVGFYWAPSANAERYEIVYTNDRGYEGIVLELPADDWTCQAGRCILFEELPSDGNYTWTVTAVNEAGTTPSEEVSFAVNAFIPASEAYLPGSVLPNSKALSFQWADTGYNATDYHIQIMDQETGQICLDKWYSTELVGRMNGVCQLDSDDYLASGSYAWRVQGRNSTSTSNWSAWKAFSVVCEECNLGTYLNTESCIIAPNGAITDPKMPFAWKTVMGASKYQIEIKHSDGTELLLTDVAPENCGVELCSYEPELELKAGESYEWSLLTYGWNDIFWGSDNRTFSVADLSEMGEVNIDFVGVTENLSLDSDNQQIIWTDPGKDVVSFRVGVSDSNGEWLFVGDLTRDEAWCDGLTCSVQFQTIPEGEGYQFTLVPYSEFNIPGEPVAVTFSNKGE